MADVIKSYLVSLSSSVDKASFDKFTAVLKGTENTVAASVSGIAGNFLKFQIAGTTAFATVGFGIVGYLDKLGMVDASMKRNALQNGMSINQYRDLQDTLKATGMTMQDALIGTAEDQARFHKMYGEIKNLDYVLGSQYEQEMVQLRALHDQVGLFQVELQRLGMRTALDLAQKLGLGDGTLEQRLEELNTFITKNIPDWSNELSSDVLPIFYDFVDIMGDLGGLAKTTAVDFTNLVGSLSGDTQLENSTGNFHDFAKAISDVVRWLGELLKMMAHFEGGAFKHLEASVHFGKSIDAFVHGRFGEASSERVIAHRLAVEADTDQPSSSHLRQQLFPTGQSVPASIQSGGWIALAQEVAQKTGIEARLIYAQMALESGNFKHPGAHNNFTNIKIPHTNTFQNFASLDEFAQRYAAVLNERRYIDNGIRTARTGAEFAAALKTKSGTFYGGDSQSSYAHNVDSLSQKYDRAITIGSINVHSAPNFSPDQHVALVKKAVKDGLDEHTRALIAETNGAFQ